LLIDFLIDFFFMLFGLRICEPKIVGDYLLQMLFYLLYNINLLPNAFFILIFPHFHSLFD